MAAATLFTSKANNTVNIVASAVSANVSLGISVVPAVSMPFTVRVKNIDATNVAYIAFGNSTITTASTTGIPIGPGETAGFSLGIGQTFAAVVSTGATVYFTPGLGE